jgi:hypothetical protein
MIFLIKKRFKMSKKNIIYLIIKTLLPFGGWKMKEKLSFGGHQMMQQ